MHPTPRRVIPFLLVLALLVAVAWWWQSERASAADGRVTASGTIEANEVTIAADVPGRVLAVEVATGDTVQAGQPLVLFDASLLRAQRAQAEAALQAAQGQHDAALAGVDAAAATLDLLAAGPTDVQLAVAESGVERARETLDAAEAAYDALPEGTQESVQAQALLQQVEAARAALDSAEAQHDDLRAGARPQQLAAAEAQVEAARAQARATEAQVTAAEAALSLLDVQVARLTLESPISGLVLRRTIEPGEVAMSGAPLLQVADLDVLTLTVFLSQSEFGRVRPGDRVSVWVDAFPGEPFSGTVRRIADQAEFTPRNTQTTEGRTLTVFAVKIALDNPAGRLKPGMTAEVRFAKDD